MTSSLVASYDALIANQFVLCNGNEAEFQNFVSNVQKAFAKWFAAEKEIVKLREELRKTNQQKTTLETQLKHARNQIHYEFQKRSQVENDRITLENLIEMIRSLLNDKNKSILDEKDMQKIAFLNSYQRSDGNKRRSNAYRLRDSSASCLSDISYDNTDDDLDASAANELREDTTPPKRKRILTDRDTSIITKTSMYMDSNSGKPKTTTTTEINLPKLNKSFSEPTLDVKFKTTGVDSAGDEHEQVWTLRPRISSESRSRHRTQSETNSSPMLRKANSASSSLNKAHMFFSTRIVKPEYCQICNQKFKFGSKALRCKECKSHRHPECEERTPIPCIPVSIRTPGLTKNEMGVIADYAGLDSPRIPGIILRLTAEVERRGLTEVGIYRVPGSDREIKELKEKFLRGKGTPNLSLIDDINVICGCLKDFLRNLKDTLVTYALWPHFIKAVSENGDNEADIQTALYRVISVMPQPNRDTLAFLIKHLQFVSQNPECRMPKQNLAKVFGPTIVGFSSANPNPCEILNETKLQSVVMEHLLNVPTNYWNRFIMLDNANTENQTHHTPEERQVVQSMLGPVQFTPTGSSSKKFSAVPCTSRFGQKNGRMPNKRTKNFFASPNLE